MLCARTGEHLSKFCFPCPLQLALDSLTPSMTKTNLFQNVLALLSRGIASLIVQVGKSSTFLIFPQISIIFFFLFFLFKFSSFLSSIGPPDGPLAHPRRPWLHYFCFAFAPDDGNANNTGDTSSSINIGVCVTSNDDTM